MRRLLTIFMCLFVCTFYTIATPKKEEGSTTRQRKKEIKHTQEAEQKRQGIENAIKILKSGVFVIYTGAPSEFAPGNKQEIARCDVRKPTLYRLVSIQENDKSVIVNYELNGSNGPPRQGSVELFYKSGAVKVVHTYWPSPFTTYAHVKRLE